MLRTLSTHTWRHLSGCSDTCLRDSLTPHRSVRWQCRTPWTWVPWRPAPQGCGCYSSRSSGVWGPPSPRRTGWCCRPAGCSRCATGASMPGSSCCDGTERIVGGPLQPCPFYYPYPPREGTLASALSPTPSLPLCSTRETHFHMLTCTYYPYPQREPP